MSASRPERRLSVTAAAAEVESAPGTVPALTLAPEAVDGHGPEIPGQERRPPGRVRGLIAADTIGLALAFVAAFSTAQALSPPALLAPAGVPEALGAAAIVVWLGIFSAYRLYERQTRAISTSTFDEIAHLFHALLAGSLLFLVCGQVLKRLADISVYTPMEAALFLLFALVFVVTARGVARTWVLPRTSRNRRTLIVGAGAVGRLVERKIETHPEYGLEVVGFVDDDPRTGDGPGVFGRTNQLPYLVDHLGVDRVILACSDAHYETTLELVRAVRRPDVHLSIVPNYFEVFASNATIEDLEGMPVVSLPPMRMARSARFVKRAFDVIASAGGLLVLSPVLAATAIAIKLDTRGPVLFRQARHGRGGRQFDILKFRTMVDGAERDRLALAHLNDMEGGGPLFKLHDDPRITRVGKRLRHWSIDELPQLWNVLRGEMSLVGPRPFVIHESEQITGWAGRRLETTPGITGLWQVLGRNDIPFEEMVKLDYIYVTNWSLAWDVRILFQTLPVVLARRGAY